jgi:hypothetical protein
MAKKQKTPFKRIRVMAEYGSSGIWATEPVGPFRHGMLRYSRLGLPDDMVARFEVWIEKFWQRKNDAFDVVSFNAEGLELARSLKRHLGPETEVVFAPEAENGGLDPEQVITGLA